MKKFIPKEKLSKKARKKLELKRRRTWGALSPATRKPPNPKAYNRKKTRREDDPDDQTVGSFIFNVLGKLR